MAGRALTAKRAEKNALHKVRTIKIRDMTIEADELSLQRLAAILLLHDPTRDPLPSLEDLGPLPWDEQPARNDAPLELDYEAIRRDIRKHFEAYVKKHSKKQLELLIVAHGGTTVSNVSDDKVLGLLVDIESALA